MYCKRQVEAMPRATTGSATGYCMKCKGKQAIVNAQIVENKKGRKMTKGSCAKCGTTVCSTSVAAAGGK
jgi:hypothetical protein